jgi:hypothetical protein
MPALPTDRVPATPDRPAISAIEALRVLPNAGGLRGHPYRRVLPKGCGRSEVPENTAKFWPYYAHGDPTPHAHSRSSVAGAAPEHRWTIVAIQAPSEERGSGPLR